MEEPNVAKLDLKSLTKFQKELHEPSDASERVFSNFSFVLVKTTWTSHGPVKFECSPSSKQLIYTLDKKFDYLNYTHIRQAVPSIRVKRKYRNAIQICLPHNFGHSVVEEAYLYYNDVQANFLDHVWLDIHSQYFMKPEKRNLYNEMVGNADYIENWNSCIPECVVNVPQPWYYTRHLGLAIPLFRSSLDTVIHKYKVRSKYADLVRMRKLDRATNTWYEIPFNHRYLHNATDKNIAFDYPELWGDCTVLTDTERDIQLGKIDEKTHDGSYDVVINDVIKVDADVPIHLGEVTTLDLHCNSPCNAMFWVAENKTATKNRNYSNYTTNSGDLKQGWHPIENIQLKYGLTPRIPEMDSDHFNQIQPWYQFPSAPTEKGYNGYSFSYDLSRADTDVGIVFSGLNARFIAKLDDCDPRKRQAELLEEGSDLDDEESDEEESQITELRADSSRSTEARIEERDKYLVRVRLLVTKRLVYDRAAHQWKLITGDKRFGSKEYMSEVMES